MLSGLTPIRPKQQRDWGADFRFLSNLLFFYHLPHRSLVRALSTMAGSTLAMRTMLSPTLMQLSAASRRSVSTASQVLRAKPLRANNAQTVSRVARRSYADAAPTPAPSPSPAPKPKKRFRALRWAWRLTWLSGLGLTGALAYSIYSLRHPEEQYEPDPNKKTLVILGRSCNCDHHHMPR